MANTSICWRKSFPISWYGFPLFTSPRSARSLLLPNYLFNPTGSSEPPEDLTRRFVQTPASVWKLLNQGIQSICVEVCFGKLLTIIIHHLGLRSPACLCPGFILTSRTLFWAGLIQVQVIQVSSVSETFANWQYGNPVSTKAIASGVRKTIRRCSHAYLLQCFSTLFTSSFSSCV